MTALLIEYCDKCSRWVHPATGSCPDCSGPLVARPVSGRGTLFTYTVNFHAYNPDIPTPYVIAIIELAEQPGLRVAVNIVDCEPDSVVCGMPVLVARADAAEPQFLATISDRNEGRLRLLATPT